MTLANEQMRAMVKELQQELELEKETASHQELLALMLGCGGNQALQSQLQEQSSLMQQQPQRLQKQQQRPQQAQGPTRSPAQQQSQQQQQQQQQQRSALPKPPPQQQQQQQQQPAKSRSQLATKQPTKKKPDAIEVAPGEGQSWTDVCQLIRSAPSLADDQAKLGVGRRTTRDRLVMDLQDGVNVEEILQRVQEVCAQAAAPATTHLLTETVEVRLDEVDPLAVASDVATAVKTISSESVSESAVHLVKAWNGTQTAYVRMSVKAAERIHQQRVRVLHTSCLATQLTPPTRGQLRCFKCLEHGHLRHRCKSDTDRSTHCIRCGQSGHLARACTAAVCCAVCKGPHRVNLGGSRVAQDLMLQTAREQRVDVVIACELYKPPRDNGRWAVDEEQSVAVIATGAYPIQRLWGSVHPGLVVATVAGVNFASCYASPSIGPSDFGAYLEAVELALVGHQNIVLAGDLNAWNEEWGCARTTSRGHTLMGAVQHLQLDVLNRGNVPTFNGNGFARESIVDVSFASASIALPEPWGVSFKFTHSDHRYVQFTVGIPGVRVDRHRRQQQHQPSQTTRTSGVATHSGTRWKTSLFSSEGYQTALVHCRFAEADTSEALVGALTRVCDATIERVGTAKHHQPPRLYWWTPELSIMRRECEVAEELLGAASEPADRDVATARLHDLRRQLQRAIQESQNEKLQELIDAVSNDVFGLGYKVVMAKLRGRTPPETDRAWPAIERADDEEVLRPVTEAEVLAIADRMAPSKAPGLDEIPNAAVKAAVREHPATYVLVFNDLLARGKFPKAWKEARLVLVPKPGKPPGDPSACRPLLIEGAVPKMFERTVVLAGGTTPQAAADLAQQVILMIGTWMAERHLHPAKTELIMVSTMRQGYEQPTVAIEGLERQLTRSLKYLGMILHDHLQWTPHVEYASAKALRAAKGVTRLMQNHGGPKGAKRRLLSSVVDSTLRYAAPVWH
ncbi:uncharacterized protein LOC128307505 [Anopheles moucheti]|uniref:uncharacterized protein LOC128307505 n=1 Tax=Anopheles moucheti TaxID=186751 RepID=UPI0022F12C78|nr:uncharacterized protein LOC128307505 [Anopheles moucheti]